MKTSDLDDHYIRAIDSVASLLYQSKPGGAAAVNGLARALRWEEYGPCEPCDDSNAPMLGGCCMVCGESATTTTREE